MKQPEKTLMRYLKYLEKNHSTTRWHLQAKTNIFTCRKRLKQDVIHRLIILKMIFRHMDKFKNHYSNIAKELKEHTLPFLNDAFTIVTNFHVRLSPDEYRSLFNISLVDWQQYESEAGKSSLTLEEVMMDLAEEAVAQYTVKAIIRSIRAMPKVNSQIRAYLWDKMSIPLSQTSPAEANQSVLLTKPVKRRNLSKIQRLGCEQLVDELLDKNMTLQEVADEVNKRGYPLSRTSIGRHDKKRRMKDKE